MSLAAQHQEACERAVLTGTMGVLHLHDMHTGECLLEPHPRVPYGRECVFTSRADLALWQESSSLG